MKDAYTVLYQKEQDVERVRGEIHALVAVIPLLIDNDTASSDLMQLLRLDSARLAGKPSGDDMPAWKPITL
jgi:hypothetical protein